VREQIGSLFVTTAGQKTVNQGHIGSLTIPLPPLAEQRRIVAKVDQLMALVDQLETQLATSDLEGRRLLNAVIHEIIDGSMKKTFEDQSKQDQETVLVAM
jgi:type I restriction enzyme S subunit